MKKRLMTLLLVVMCFLLTAVSTVSAMSEEESFKNMGRSLRARSPKAMPNPKSGGRKPPNPLPARRMSC